MEKEGPLSDCDSDSSEGLPELFPDYIFDVAKLAKNEVVWAEYKDFHWPALVRGVDKKNRKVKIWYLDSPGKCFKVPFNKIHDFADSDFSKKVIDDAKKHPFAEKHDQVKRRSDVFLFRGRGDNPLQFFDLSKPYFLLETLNSGISDVKLDSEGVSIENDSDKNDNLEEKPEESLLSIENDGDKNDNLKEKSDESDVEGRTTTKILAELNEEDSPYDDEMIAKILSYITSGHVDNYLTSIVNSKITNERHKLYFNAVEKGQVEQFHQSQPPIPLRTRDLHYVLIYLQNLYEQKIGNEKLNKLHEYIVHVWLPEALDKAVSLVEAQPLKLPDYSCGSSQSSLLLKSEVSNLAVNSSSYIFSSLPSKEKTDLTIDSDSQKLSSSPILIESSESPIDCGNKESCSPTQVDAPKSPVDSISHGIICAPKRKLNLDSLVENQNSSGLEIEACSPGKKKFTGRKMQKGSPKT